MTAAEIALQPALPLRLRIRQAQLDRRAAAADVDPVDALRDVRILSGRHAQEYRAVAGDSGDHRALSHRRDLMARVAGRGDRRDAGFLLVVCRRLRALSPVDRSEQTDRAVRRDRRLQEGSLVPARRRLQGPRHVIAQSVGLSARVGLGGVRDVGRLRDRGVLRSDRGLSRRLVGPGDLAGLQHIFVVSSHGPVHPDPELSRDPAASTLSSPSLSRPRRPSCGSCAA